MHSGIIVADDDVVVRGLLRTVLMTAGHDVFATSSGEEAIGLASRMQAALILLDLNMPRLNGLLTCERLRGLPGYAGTPIAILTAYDNVDARSAASRVGSTLFIAKPFQPTVLLATLAPYLASVRPRTAAADPDANRCHALDRGKSILNVYRGR